MIKHAFNVNFYKQSLTHFASSSLLIIPISIRDFGKEQQPSYDSPKKNRSKKSKANLDIQWPTSAADVTQKLHLQKKRAQRESFLFHF